MLICPSCGEENPPKFRLCSYCGAALAGAIVGEIGLFAPDNRRTGSIVCATDCTLYSLSADGMAQLYYQNPKLGFHVMRLIVARLMHAAKIAAQQAAAQGPGAAAATQPGAA